MLILKNDSFAVNQDTDVKEADFSSFNKFIDVLDNNSGISQEDVHNILNWRVNNTLYNLDSILRQLRINTWNDGLNGYCEITQSISLIPLEKLRLKVTKNNTTECFNYPYNYAFGTVTFHILENGNIVEKTYLIDCTYRQFFSTVYCNEGMYYSNSIATDSGYFANKVFATELLSNGYIEINKENALSYGLPFYKAGLDLNKSNKVCNINFYNNIKNITSDYAAKDYELN